MNITATINTETVQLISLKTPLIGNVLKATINIRGKTKTLVAVIVNNIMIAIAIPSLKSGVYPYSVTCGSHVVVKSYITVTEESSPTDAMDGKSAYEVAVENGFEGDVYQWLLSLKGAKGEIGDTGVNGHDGYTPIKNIDYFDGEKGLKGDKGDTGAPGYTPIKGIDYFDGLPGSDATVTKSAVESVLTGEISSHTHAGGGGGLTQSQILTRQL